MTENSKFPYRFLPNDLPELSNEWKNKLIELLQTFSEVFTKSDKLVAVQMNVKSRINTDDHAPIK